MEEKRKIGIIGVGMVGGALLQVFEEPLLFDTGKGIGSFDEVDTADVIFICVPTPHDEEKGGFDLTYVEESLSALSGEKIIVIKSTVLPGTTEWLQEKYPQHILLFNPEFLVEKTAHEDMKNPERQIVGYTKKSKEYAEYVLNLLPHAPYGRVLPATEAEMIKYFGNAFLASKVVFANQIYDLCMALGIDYDVVKESVSADSRIGASHLEIFHNGSRGYGGKCFPKDLRSLIQKGEEFGVDLQFLKMVEGINNELIKKRP